MKKTKSKFVMMPGHKKWRQFCNRLAGPEGCDFKDGGWKCDSSLKRPFARKILADMGANVEASLLAFESSGGYCDCEILFNVDR